MGVRCTLLGHRYGEAEIEREREERGEEAVVTIREVKTCSRCGDRSVVSENKEVTTAGNATDVATPEDGDAAPTSEPRPTEAESGDPVAEESVAAGSVGDADLDAGPEGSDGDAADASAEAADAAAGETGEGPEHDPETDDGVILDDGDDEDEPAEREYGEWPDAEEDHASAEADPAAADDEEPEPWPDSDEDADEGYDATTPEGEPADVEYPGAADAEPTGSGAASTDAEGPTGAEEAAGEESADVTEPTDDAELLDESDEPAHQQADSTEAQPADGGAEFERAGESSSPSAPSTGGTELYCPACGYRDPSRDGSLREGDICPECRKGYLAAGE